MKSKNRLVKLKKAQQPTPGKFNHKAMANFRNAQLAEDKRGR